MSEPIYLCDKCGRFETAEHNDGKCGMVDALLVYDDEALADLARDGQPGYGSAPILRNVIKNLALEVQMHRRRESSK